MRAQAGFSGAGSGGRRPFFATDSRIAGGPLLAAAFALSAVVVMALLNAGTQPGSREIGLFPTLWQAARAVIEGHAANAYRVGAAKDSLVTPQFLLLFSLVGILSYSKAIALWVSLNVAGLGAIGLILWRNPAPRALLSASLLLSPTTLACVLTPGIGAAVAPIFLIALLAARDRPILAGILLALLSTAPQYLLIAPFLLAGRGAWRALAIGAAGALALTIASAAFLGLDIWAAFLGALGEAARPARAAAVQRVAIHDVVGAFGGGPAARIVPQISSIALCVAAAVAAGRYWRRDAGAGFALLATAFASPALGFSDWPLITAGLLAIARGEGRLPAPLQAVGALLWIAPVFTLTGARDYAPLTALAALGGMIATLFYWQSKTPASRRLTDPAY